MHACIHTLYRGGSRIFFKGGGSIIGLQANKGGPGGGSILGSPLDPPMVIRVYVYMCSARHACTLTLHKYIK